MRGDKANLISCEEIPWRNNKNLSMFAECDLAATRPEVLLTG
jgi:hypothetical protein